MATRIQHRRDTASNWTSNNPTLAAGEIGFETDENKFKIGDGSTAWNSQDYAGGSSGPVLYQGYTLPGDLSTINDISLDNGLHIHLSAQDGILGQITSSANGTRGSIYYFAQGGGTNVLECDQAGGDTNLYFGSDNPFDGTHGGQNGTFNPSNQSELFLEFIIINIGGGNQQAYVTNWKILA